MCALARACRPEGFAYQPNRIPACHSAAMRRRSRLLRRVKLCLWRIYLYIYLIL